MDAAVNLSRLVALFFVAACTPRSALEDPRSYKNAVALTIMPPSCLVATTTEPFELSYVTDSDAQISVEATQPGKELRSLMRQASTANAESKLVFPPGLLAEGKNLVTVWARGAQKIPSSQAFDIDVRVVTQSTSADDLDGDCYSARTGDCNDQNPLLNPGRTELCADLIDNDCNGLTDVEDPACSARCADNDKDGFTSSVCGGTDCDDANPNTHPQASETCDALDNDCDAQIDEDFDKDGDLFVLCGSNMPVTRTVDGKVCPNGFNTCADCDDADNTTYPGAPEYCLAGDTKHHSCRETITCQVCGSASATATSPVIFFTDLLSAPNTGGKNDQGAFVTVYGLRFGATRGTSKVTIGGVEVAAYEIWGGRAPGRDLETITFQLGSAVSSGDLVVTVGDVASNALPFQVRPGNVYLVDPNQPTNGTGTFASPFNSLQAATTVAVAGDTFYVKNKSGNGLNSVDTATCTNWTIPPSAYSDTRKSTPSRPIAYIGYPDDPPMLGGAATPCACPPLYPTCDTTYSTVAIDLQDDHHVIANFNFVSTRKALTLQGIGKRLIGNTFTNVKETGAYNFLETTSSVNDVKLLGSLFYSIDAFAIYLNGQVSSMEIGWNEYRHIGGGAVGLGGYLASSRNVIVHDNFFFKNSWGAVLIGSGGFTIGTSLSTGAKVYNNIVANENTGMSTCDVMIFEKDWYGGPGTLPSYATFEHNTFVRSESSGSACMVQIVNGGGIEEPGRYVFRNNNFVFNNQSNLLYFEYENENRDAAAFEARNNLYHSSTTAPVLDAAGTAKFGNPNFPRSDVSAGSGRNDRDFGDFTPGAATAGVDTGLSTTFCADYFGRSRTQSAAPDIGAVERF
jgi:Putative metal-binding motif